MAQQVLGGHHDEGLAELAVDLAPQQVEVVGGGGAVGDLCRNKCIESPLSVLNKGSICASSLPSIICLRSTFTAPELLKGKALCGRGLSDAYR